MEYSKIITKRDIGKRLSETSEMPVQNKVITATLNNLFTYVDVLPEVTDSCPKIVCVKGTGFYMLYEDADGTRSYKKVAIEE